MSRLKLILLGDICSANRYSKAFSEDSIQNIFGDTLDKTLNADIVVVNLECPLVEQLKPIRKTGPNLAGPLVTAYRLAEAGVTAVSLANNHIMDQDFQGLFSTESVCHAAGIEVFGAGKNLLEARQPYIAEKNGVKVGFYSMAETEFSIAGEKIPGANSIEQIHWCQDISNLSRDTDCCVVLLHAGKEHYTLPSPDLQRVCRGIADYGADVIVCQHSHCIGAMEHYGNSFIFYGQGNCLFDYPGQNSDLWNTGMLIEVDVSERGLECCDRFYFKQYESRPFLQLLVDTELETKKLEQTSLDNQVLDERTVLRKWKEIAIREGGYLHLKLSGFNGMLIKLLVRFGLSRLITEQSQIIYALNLLRCRTHRELIETYLIEKCSLDFSDTE